MSARNKITFDTINKSNYTVIDPMDIAETNKRIKKEMTPIIREFERKQTESGLQADKNIKK
jgi:hypothetical protein